MSKEEAIAVALIFWRPLISLIIYEFVDRGICSIGKQLTRNVSDKIMIPLGLITVAIFVVLVAMIVAKVAGWM